MEQGSFCFLNDMYFIDFPDSKLMRNKEMVNGELRSRPCFFAFKDVQNPDIMWLVPVSSKVDKYREHYNKHVARNKFCTTLYFGNVTGREAVFLIQNICPATAKYISNVYIDKNNVPIRVDFHTAQAVIKNAKKTLSDYFRGKPIIFPNVRTIKRQLNIQLEQERAALATSLPPCPADILDAGVTNEFSEVAEAIKPTTVKERLAMAAATTSPLSLKTPKPPER